jgi:steroid delta-isomerase
MTLAELLADHVTRFNDGVRCGDFESMLELFADDSVLEFEGVPVGPFHGIDAIRAAYREQPPDDEIAIEGPRQDADTIAARYGWLRDGGRRSGELRLTVREARIVRLVVTFDRQQG